MAASLVKTCLLGAAARTALALKRAPVVNQVQVLWGWLLFGRNQIVIFNVHNAAPCFHYLWSGQVTKTKQTPATTWTSTWTWIWTRWEQEKRFHPDKCNAIQVTRKKNRFASNVTHAYAWWHQELLCHKTPWTFGMTLQNDSKFMG